MKQKVSSVSLKAGFQLNCFPSPTIIPGNIVIPSFLVTFPALGITSSVLGSFAQFEVELIKKQAMELEI